MIYICRMNKAQLDFVTYCIGALSDRLGMSQPVIFDKLSAGNIIMSYIVPAYDVLHTYGGDYITDDLISLMKKKGVLS